MNLWRRTVVLVLALTLLLAGCASPREAARGATDAVGSSAKGPSGPKRITTAIMADPPALVQALTGFGLRGTDAVEDLVLSGLAIDDNQGALRPLLAEALPSVENGLWTLLPSGGMQLTWRIREGASWHDGTPLTSSDLLFAATVGQDKDVPEFGNAVYGFVEGIEAHDARTVVVRWKQPYIEADRMFATRSFAVPMPRHLLEQAYGEQRAAFTQLPYWSTEFVGTGPYRVRQFVRGSHLVLDAFDGFTLGRPKVDGIEVRFIPDPTTIVANILADSIELTLGKTLSVEQATEIRDQWRNGRIEVGPSNAVSIYAQFLNPNPPVVRNPELRRALLHAVDRSQLADELMAGLTSVAHSFMFPNQAQYRDVEARLPRYSYDPRRAGQMIEALGYVRQPDGTLRDGAGQPLAVELRTYTVDINQKATLAVADAWQRVGVRVEPNVMSPQAARDNEYVFTYPAFMLQRYTSDTAGLRNLYSSRAPTPQNNFRSGNVARYVNPEFDAMLDRYFSAIPNPERLEVLGQILHHIADQLPQMGLFYDVEPTVIGGRLQNVSGRWPTSTQAWNAHAWDVQ